jgi:HK97 family phage major capsid protein
MKFDEMNVEQLEARQAEIAGMDTESATTEELEERANELEAIRNELQARIDAAAKAEEERQKVAEGNDTVIKEFVEEKEMENRFAVNSPEYRDAFLRKLQGKEITAEERAAITATAAIPTQTMNEIVHRLELNPMIGAVDLTQIPGYVTYPAESSINNASWVDMDTASTDSADALQAIQLGAYKLIKTVEISADVDAMSVDAFEAWLVSRLANKIEKALDAGILTGTGVTQATGIATTKATADGTFKRSGIKWGDICGIMGALKGEYHPNASFCMNPTLFFGKVLGMTDTAGQRVVVNEPQADRKFNLLGYPVIVDGNCGAEDILFGDFKAYKLNLAKAVEVKRSEEAEFRKGSAVYRAMTLADGKLADVNAIVRYVATT